MISIFVQAKPTEAVYTLRDPTEVQMFLSRIIAWGHTPANAWHRKQSCTGWALDPSLETPRSNGYLTPSDGGDTLRSGALPRPANPAVLRSFPQNRGTDSR